MYTGVIEGVGPRYCPSIEDKITRFADKASHQIFLEPEGLTTHEIYPNGISTSLPFDVQLAIVRSIPGLETRTSCAPATRSSTTTTTRATSRPRSKPSRSPACSFAGQINGTTGYEEAAAQGLLAGINAGLQVQGRDAWSPRRHEAYLGVLVDDLITRGVSEPYRMFTSRAEYRLQLREDNADMRLTEAGRELGVVDDARWDAFNRKRDAIARETERLKSTWVNPAVLPADAATRLIGQPIDHEYSLFELLRRPNLDYAQVLALPGGGAGVADARVAEQVEIAAKYQGYIDRQNDEVEKHREQESLRLPADLDYTQLTALSMEVRQRLQKARPETLGQAARLQGITPAAISVLLIYAKRGFTPDELPPPQSLPRMRERKPRMTVEAQLSAGIAALGLALPDGAEARLLAYLALLDKWNRVYNLTAVRDAERMVSHHLLDSLAAVPVFDELNDASPSPQPSPVEGEGANAGLRPPTAIDVGSGGGLPGIPLAIARPELQVTLIDSIAKKTAFLLQAKAELGLKNLNVVTGRVEDFRPESGFDIVTSRAFSDLREFVNLTRHLLNPGGRWLAMKGLYPNEEIALLPAGVKVSADHALARPGAGSEPPFDCSGAC
jgi:16S rRNA (guanine(527)-N(7))-methyltransferase RsmG